MRLDRVTFTAGIALGIFSATIAVELGDEERRLEAAAREHMVQQEAARVRDEERELAGERELAEKLERQKQAEVVNSERARLEANARAAFQNEQDQKAEHFRKEEEARKQFAETEQRRLESALAEEVKTAATFREEQARAESAAREEARRIDELRKEQVRQYTAQLEQYRQEREAALVTQHVEVERREPPTFELAEPQRTVGPAPTYNPSSAPGMPHWLDVERVEGLRRNFEAYQREREAGRVRERFETRQDALGTGDEERRRAREQLERQLADQKGRDEEREKERRQMMREMYRDAGREF